MANPSKVADRYLNAREGQREIQAYLKVLDNALEDARLIAKQDIMDLDIALAVPALAKGQAQQAKRNMHQSMINIERLTGPVLNAIEDYRRQMSGMAKQFDRDLQKKLRTPAPEREVQPSLRDLS